MYFQYKSLQSISEATGIPTATLAATVRRESWDLDRAEQDHQSIEQAFSVRKMTISRILSITTEQLERGLGAIANRMDPPTASEMKVLTDVLANLDKVARLDANRSTENVNINAQINSMTVDKIRDIIKQDPFLNDASPAKAPKGASEENS